MVVEKSIKNLEGSQVALTLTVDAESIEKAYQAKMKKYQANIQLDGFRKGKAPISVIERKYGDAIREESTFEALEENLKEAIDSIDEKDRPLAYSTPVLQDEETLLPFKKDENVTFTVHYDVYPTLKVENYKGREIAFEGAEVTEADVNEELDKIRDQNAIVKTKNGKAAKDNVVTVDYVELDENGEEKADTKREGFTFTIGSGYNYYRIDEDIIGMKKGEEKVIEKQYAEDDVTFKGAKVTLKVVMNEVKKREVPELTDELAQDVKDDYKTVEDLVNGTKAKLEGELADNMKNDKIAALMASLVEETKFDVPASMVDIELDQSWRRFVQQSGLEEEKLLQFFSMQNQTKESIVAEWRPAAEKNIREQVILEEIKKAEDFPLDEEEFKKACDEQLKNIKDEGNMDYYRNMIKDDMQFAKVVPFLLENNTFKSEKNHSYKEYMQKKNDAAMGL